jgi:hypothetical protein
MVSRKYAAQIPQKRDWPGCGELRWQHNSCPSMALLHDQLHWTKLSQHVGVHFTAIRGYAGHASTATTNCYVSTDLKRKRDALTAFWERAGISKPASKSWKPSTEVLELLRSL